MNWVFIVFWIYFFIKKKEISINLLSKSLFNDREIIIIGSQAICINIDITVGDNELKLLNPGGVGLQINIEILGGTLGLIQIE
jgi:hypothetical protein